MNTGENAVILNYSEWIIQLGLYLLFSFVGFYIQNYIFIPHKKNQIICFVKQKKVVNLHI